MTTWSRRWSSVRTRRLSAICPRSPYWPSRRGGHVGNLRTRRETPRPDPPPRLAGVHPGRLPLPTPSPEPGGFHTGTFRFPPGRASLSACHSSAFWGAANPGTLMNHGLLTAAKPSRFRQPAWWQNQTSSVLPSPQRMVAYQSRGSLVTGARPVPRGYTKVTDVARWEPSTIMGKRVARHLGPGRAGMT